MGFNGEVGSSSHALEAPPPSSGEDTPLIGDDPNRSQSSQGKTFTNVFIAIVGAGVLGLPYAFKRTGWVLSLMMLLITANMGSEIVSTLVKLGLCVNLFFTLPIMMNPDYEILERRLLGGRYCLWLRWLSVLLVSVVALLVPNFADFLSLVVSGVCCSLGFVLPPLFHLLVVKDELG